MQLTFHQLYSAYSSPLPVIILIVADQITDDGIDEKVEKAQNKDAIFLFNFVCEYFLHSAINTFLSDTVLAHCKERITLSFKVKIDNQPLVDYYIWSFTKLGTFQSIDVSSAGWSFQNKIKGLHITWA